MSQWANQSVWLLEEVLDDDQSQGTGWLLHSEQAFVVGILTCNNCLFSLVVVPTEGDWKGTRTTVRGLDQTDTHGWYMSFESQVAHGCILMDLFNVLTVPCCCEFWNRFVLCVVACCLLPWGQSHQGKNSETPRLHAAVLLSCDRADYVLKVTLSCCTGHINRTGYCVPR